MILEHDYADDIIEQIDLELDSLYKNNRIEVTNFRIRNSGDFQWLYDQNFLSFPSSTIGATSITRINNSYFEILASHWKVHHPDLIDGNIEKTVERLRTQEFPPEVISSAITDKLLSLLYKYDDVLKITKEASGLFGIEDEEKILLIHLKKYDEILKNPAKQISILHGIDLNKKVSDLILKVYIRFIQQRLELLNPPQPTIENISLSQPSKILWNGSQKDLVELFVELQSKGWINEFNYGDRSKIAKAICNLFDLTKTKRKIDSDPENSFYQKLKGIHNPVSKEREFDTVLGPQKDRKFSTIITNKQP